MHPTACVERHALVTCRREESARREGSVSLAIGGRWISARPESVLIPGLTRRHLRASGRAGIKPCRSWIVLADARDPIESRAALLYFFGGRLSHRRQYIRCDSRKTDEPLARLCRSFSPATGFLC